MTNSRILFSEKGKYKFSWNTNSNSTHSNGRMSGMWTITFCVNSIINLRNSHCSSETNPVKLRRQITSFFFQISKFFSVKRILREMYFHFKTNNLQSFWKILLVKTDYTSCNKKMNALRRRCLRLFGYYWFRWTYWALHSWILSLETDFSAYLYPKYIFP